MKKIIVCINVFLIMALAIALPKNVYGVNIDLYSKVDYTDEFKEYLKLPYEERIKLNQPRMFNYSNSLIQNDRIKALGTNMEKSFNLKDVIGNNLIIKDQGKTNTCWAFSTIAALETNLALNNKSKTYDFSEKHMNYATTRLFKDNKINEKGFNRTAAEMGSHLVALAYLTNGLGAINEAEMPFDENTSLIDINEIQNKKVSSRVYDVSLFPTVDATNDLTNIKLAIKDHIKKYGGVSAGVYGASFVNDYYNNTNAAMYCDDKEKCKANHAVCIVGWDDDFSRENFNEKHRPKNNGAWIVKNSWGTVHEEDLMEWKKSIYEVLMSLYSSSELESKGITDYTKVPDALIMDFFKQLGFEVEIKNNKIYMNVGKDGFMYISYEDVNIYSDLVGILKSTDTVDYDNIYKYNDNFFTAAIAVQNSKVYLANTFEKKSNETEYLNEVSLFIPETYTCKVYVNSSNSSLKKEDLKPVKLVEGESKTLDAGYHTLEFEEAVKITGDEFAVAIEIQSNDGKVAVPLEANYANTMYDGFKIESNKCFVTIEGGLEQNQWNDLSKLSSSNANLIDGDSTISAFTTTLPKEEKKEEETPKNNENNKNPEPTQEPIKKDETTSNKILPNTGVKSILIFIAVLSIFGVYMKIRYKDLKRYVK